jgi:hypothetical protein
VELITAIEKFSEKATEINMAKTKENLPTLFNKLGSFLIRNQFSVLTLHVYNKEMA